MSARGSNLLRDIYRDLRDRRLLSIVIVLIAAIVAVPFLIKSDADPDGAESASAAASVPLEGAEIVNPVVLAEEPELRDFRGRLDEFRSRDPFKQQLTNPLGGSLEDTSTATPADASSVEAPSASDSGVTAPIDDPSVSATPTDPASADPVAPEEQPADPVDPAQTPEEPKTTLYTTRIDVRVGPIGDTGVLEDVKEMAYLPDRQHPVVQYLFSDLDLTRAAFVVSPAVVSSEGEGKCQPNPQDCQFLLLEVGQEQSFEYEDGQRYRLKLVDATLHEQSTFEGDVTADRSERPSSFTAGRSDAALTG